MKLGVVINRVKQYYVKHLILDKKTFEYFCVSQRIYKPIYVCVVQLNVINMQISVYKVKVLNYIILSLSYEEYDNTYDNLTNLLAMKKNYNSAVFSIVSESQFAEQYGIITEKTFNSIVAGMPFVVCGHRGAVNQINRLGFETYDTFFDQLYDDLDNSVRIKFMIELNGKLIKE